MDGRKTYTGIGILTGAYLLGWLAPEAPGWLVPVLQTIGAGLGGVGVAHKAQKFIDVIKLAVEAVKEAKEPPADLPS